jgi:hypothetical protein
MKKFLAAVCFLASLVVAPTAYADFPIKAGDPVGLVLYCAGEKAGEALLDSVSTVGPEWTETMKLLFRSGLCVHDPLRPFQAHVARVVGFGIDWENDEFALVELTQTRDSLEGSNMYSVVWAQHILQGVDRIGGQGV